MTIMPMSTGIGIGLARGDPGDAGGVASSFFAGSGWGASGLEASALAGSVSKSFRSEIAPSVSRSTRMSGLVSVIFDTLAYLGHEKSMPSSRRRSKRAVGVF